MTALPPLTVEERERLAKLAEAATPGPWAYEAVNEKGNDWCVGVIVDANDQPVSGRVVGEQDGAVDEFVCFGDGLQNAAYIAAANPSVLLRLLAQVREAEGRWQKLKERLKQLDTEATCPIHTNASANEARAIAFYDAVTEMIRLERNP